MVGHCKLEGFDCSVVRGCRVILRDACLQRLLVEVPEEKQRMLWEPERLPFEVIEERHRLKLGIGSIECWLRYPKPVVAVAQTFPFL